MNISWNSVLGLASLCLLGWYYSLNQDDSDLQNLVKTPDSPEYIGNKMETTVFSPEGKKQYLAFSEKVEHFGQNGKIKRTECGAHERRDALSNRRCGGGKFDAGFPSTTY